MLTLSQAIDGGVVKSPVSTGEIVAKYRTALDRSEVPPYLNDAEWAWDLGCEDWLCDAFGRWLQGSCRSPDSRIGYVRVMSRWVMASQRRSLEAQWATGSLEILDWLATLRHSGLSDRYVAWNRDVVGSWFGWLLDHDLIGRNPVNRRVRRSVRIDHQSVVKADGMRQALTLDEARRVARWCLEMADPAAGLSVALQMTGGLRSIEVHRLNREHLVDRDGVISITVSGKGRKTRRVILELLAAQAWRRFAPLRPNRAGALLAARSGARPSRATIQRWAKDAAAVVGRSKEISSHDLRKTAATLLIDRGATLEQVQAHLGHCSPQLTLRCYVTRRRPMQTTTGIEA